MLWVVNASCKAFLPADFAADDLDISINKARDLRKARKRWQKPRQPRNKRSPWARRARTGNVYGMPRQELSSNIVLRDYDRVCHCGGRNLDMVRKNQRVSDMLSRSIVPYSTWPQRTHGSTIMPTPVRYCLEKLLLPSLDRKGWPGPWWPYSQQVSASIFTWRPIYASRISLAPSL